MLNGGYQIIDCKGIEVETGGSELIPGIYSTIESTNKRTVLSGLVLDEEELDDIAILFEVVGDELIGAVNNIRFIVSSDDTLAVTRVMDFPELPADKQAGRYKLVCVNTTPGEPPTYGWVADAD